MSAVSFASWGNYPAVTQTSTACHWLEQLPEQFRRVREGGRTTLPYGAGRSYGDSCLASSGHVLDMRPLDRFISADWSTGRLTAEAGTTIAEILAAAIPHGWFIAVTPGTKFVTLGGAIANDVHGKNHHRQGTFGRHVRRFGLCRSDRGRVTCSPYEETDLFAATIGGLGLTGLIEWAEIQLVSIASSRLECVLERFGELDEFFELSEELDHRHEYCVAWVDCVARGKATGRGVYMAADFATEGPLRVDRRRELSWLPTARLRVVNSLSVRAFNTLYWHAAPGARSRRRIDYVPFFYPLDRVLRWNRIYGPRGFQQYQAVIPQREARAGIAAMLEAVAAARTGSFLAVLKRCGELSSPGWLSFPMAGTTLALDFPQSEVESSDLFERLDAILREAGGRLYPAKDAHVSGADFRLTYPAWQRVEALRDPALMSRFWQRVTQ